MVNIRGPTVEQISTTSSFSSVNWRRESGNIDITLYISIIYGLYYIYKNYYSPFVHFWPFNRDTLFHHGLEECLVHGATLLDRRASHVANQQLGSRQKAGGRRWSCGWEWPPRDTRCCCCCCCCGCSKHGVALQRKHNLRGTRVQQKYVSLKSQSQMPDTKAGVMHWYIPLILWFKWEKCTALIVGKKKKSPQFLVNSSYWPRNCTDDYRKLLNLRCLRWMNPTP